MKIFLNIRTIFLFIIILTLFISIFWIIEEDSKEEIVNSKLNKTHYLLATDFLYTTKKVEDTFTRMYESARVISLLPGVRNIKGSNLINKDEDIIKNGRLDKKSYYTIQQVYNNMAFKVAVSEIYIVLEGLDYKKGETPFLMMDNLVVQNNAKQQKLEEKTINDIPEEIEEEEYEHYPKQIATFRRTNPNFNFKELSEIPALLSPVVRTCDNTQYISKSKGDAQETSGLLYSIPFYNTQNNLKGIVSVVFRTNTLESLLLDIPFLIITPQDKIKAKELGFTMPKKISNYLIYNKKNNSYIFDRRNKKIKELVDKYPNGNGKDLFVSNLDIKSKEKWQIYYNISDEYFLDEIEKIEKTNDKKLFILFILSIIIMLTIIIKRKNELKEIEEINNLTNCINNISNSNTSNKIDVNKNSKIYKLANAYNSYLIKKEKGLKKDTQTLQDIKRIATAYESSYSEEGYLIREIKNEPDNPQLKEVKDCINKIINSTKKHID